MSEVEVNARGVLSLRPEIRLSDADIEHLFGYHAPGEDARRRHAGIDEIVKSTAKAVRTLVPRGPERTIAVRTLIRFRQECNAAIALSEPYTTEE